MAIGKQAKILNDKQQNLILKYMDGSRYPLRNKIIFLLSSKAGLRAKEIANIEWSMICTSDGVVSDTINLTNKASKGKYSGRIIPIHKELKAFLKELLDHRQQNEWFSFNDKVIFSERGNKTSAQAIVNFFRYLYLQLPWPL